jgi:hypothetical protein
VIPAACTTARTAPPAITPVPGLAGSITTFAAPKRPMTRWGIVPPRMLTRFICLWASFTPEAEPAAALDHGGAAADRHDALGPLAPFAPFAPFSVIARHVASRWVMTDDRFAIASPLTDRRGWADALGTKAPGVCEGQKLKPPSRAASARALTRP